MMGVYGSRFFEGRINTLEQHEFRNKVMIVVVNKKLQPSSLYP